MLAQAPARGPTLGQKIAGQTAYHCLSCEPRSRAVHRKLASAASSKYANDRVTFVASHGGWDEFPLITSGG